MKPSKVFGGRKLKLRVKKAWLPKWNSSHEDKIALRKWLLGELGVKDPRILDCYAGPGQMWKEAYGETANYLGLDRQWFKDERKLVVCDSMRFLKTADLEDFDIFDLDAFGSPMEGYAIICTRFRWKTRKRIGILLTDGTGFNAKMNSTSQGFLSWIGVNRHSKTRVQWEERDTFLKMALAKGVEEIGGQVAAIKVLSKERGSVMRYIGLVIEPETVRAAPESPVRGSGPRPPQARRPPRAKVGAPRDRQD